MTLASLFLTPALYFLPHATLAATIIVADEPDVLAGLVPLESQGIIEPGCGNARMVRELLQRYPGCRITGLEVDQIQHAKNLVNLQEGLRFIAACAEAIPFPDAGFELALMLKSLHHMPLAMDRALDEVVRVLRPGGCLYVSEPVYADPLNEVIRLFNDEGEVRAAGPADRASGSAIAAG